MTDPSVWRDAAGKGHLLSVKRDHAKLRKLSKSSQMGVCVWVDAVEAHLSVFLQIQRGGAFSVADGAREFPTCAPY